MSRRSVQRGLGVLACGVLSFTSPSARADVPRADGESLNLDYEAPAGCPRHADLVRAIHKRAPRGWSAADDRSFRVRIERVEREYTGRLQVERQGRVLSVREIRGSSCDVVSTALAVFVAIALDPANVEPAEPAPPPQPPVDAPVSPAPPVPIPPPLVPSTPSAERGSPPLPPPPAARRPAPARWYWGSGFDFATVLHPTVALGGRVHAELTRFAGGAHVAPELRVSWGWADFSEFPTRGGEASFRFLTGRAEACALLAHAPFTAEGCAGFEAGEIQGVTRNLPKAGGTNKAWYAPSLSFRPGLFILDGLSLEAELGMVVPLSRATFYVSDPERIVYRIPTVAFTATAGFRFWARLP